MKDALAIHRTLLEHEKPHEIVRLPRAISSADELPGALGLPADRCLAVRVFSASGDGDLPQVGILPGPGDLHRMDDLHPPEGTERTLVAVIVAAGVHPSPAAVRAAAGVRHAVPAPAGVINAVTDYAAPLVAPLLLPGGVRVLVDRDVLDGVSPRDSVHTATGEPWTALRVRAGDLVTLSSATPADLGRPARRDVRPARRCPPTVRRAAQTG
jgi:prolyl-tRNA editing enzyme YbaK/EbsC (Cys-tRNA(Pro) deacylase)